MILKAYGRTAKFSRNAYPTSVTSNKMLTATTVMFHNPGVIRIVPTMVPSSLSTLIRPSVQVLVGGSRSIPGLQALLADVGHEDVWKDHGTVLLLVDLEQ
jgi:hypothetical protein